MEQSWYKTERPNEYRDTGSGCTVGLLTNFSSLFERFPEPVPKNLITLKQGFKNENKENYLSKDEQSQYIAILKNGKLTRLKNGKLTSECNTFRDYSSYCYIYVITKEKKLLVYTGDTENFSHACLAGGEDVFAAGVIKVDHNHDVTRISNESGHYKPTLEEMIPILKTYFCPKLKYYDPECDWVVKYIFENHEPLLYKGNIQGLSLNDIASLDASKTFSILDNTNKVLFGEEVEVEKQQIRLEYEYTNSPLGIPGYSEHLPDDSHQSRYLGPPAPLGLQCKL